MAKKKKAAADQEQPTESAADKAAREELADRAHHMRQMATEAGATGGTAMIFRKVVEPGQKTAEPFLESVPLEVIWDNPHEYLQRKWGGGEYRVTLRDENRAFVKGMSNLRYVLAGSPIEPDKVTPETRKLDELEAQVREALEKKGSGGDVSSTDLMRLMLEITREQARELRNPPAAALSGNPAEMAVSLMATLQASQAPLITALLDRAAEPADSMTRLREMVEMMAMLRELTQSNEPKRGGLDGVIDRLADPLAGLLNQHVANQQNGTAPPSTMTGAPAPSPDQPGNNVSTQPRWLQLMGPYLPQLLQFAAAGRDPQITADFIAEGIPDEHLGMIYTELSKPDFVDDLGRHVPETRTHAAWFQTFAQRVLEWVTPPDAPDEGSAPEVGTVAGGADAE